MYEEYVLVLVQVLILVVLLIQVLARVRVQVVLASVLVRDVCNLLLFANNTVLTDTKR